MRVGNVSSVDPEAGSGKLEDEVMERKRVTRGYQELQVELRPALLRLISRGRYSEHHIDALTTAGPIIP